MAKVLCAEIGHSFIKFCEMDYKSKNPKIYRCYEIPTPPETVSDGYIVKGKEDLLAQAIRKSFSVHKIKTKKIIFTIVSGRIINREVLVPAVKATMIDGVIASNLTEYFPVDLSNYEVTRSLIDTISEGEDIGKYKVMVMAAEKSMIEGYQELARRCQLDLINVCYGGDSVLQATKVNSTEKCEAVIKIEEQYTVITIIKAGKLLLQRNVNYGIEPAIEEITNRSEFDAMNYVGAWKLAKKKCCLKVALGPDTRIIESVADDDDDGELADAKSTVTRALAPLVNSIVRVVDFHNSHSQNNPLEVVSIVGMGAEFVGLHQLLINEIGSGYESEERIPKAAALKSSASAYIACIGAGIASSGFYHADQQKKEKSKNNYIPATVLLVILFALVDVALYLFAMTMYDDAVSEQKLLESQKLQYQEGKNVYEQYQSVQMMYLHVEYGHALTKRSNDGLLNFLAELEQKLPMDAEVTDFTSDDAQCVISLVVPDKETAAGLIQVLRDFDSLMSVSVNSVAEEVLEVAEAYEEDVDVDADAGAEGGTAGGEEIGELTTELEEVPVETLTQIRFTVRCLYYPNEPADPATAQQMMTSNQQQQE